MDHERMRRQLGGGDRGEGIIEPVIDLVGDEADAGPLRSRDQPRQRLARHHRSRWIGRAADQHPFQRRLAMGGEQRLTGQRVAGLARGLDQDRLATERGEDMPIRRIAGDGHGDAIARLEHREESQDECARGPRGDHDPIRIDRTAIGFPVMPGDALSQRGDAERRGVIHTAAAQRSRGRFNRGRRRPRRGLPDLHMNDVAAGGLDSLGRGHHIHHDERRDTAAA